MTKRVGLTTKHIIANMQHVLGKFDVTAVRLNIVGAMQRSAIQSKTPTDLQAFQTDESS